jgi:hypothetical protein
MNRLIEINDFPTVIQAADVKSLRIQGEGAACSAFMRAYLGFDEHSRFTLQTLIHSLSGGQRGGAYFINGVFGSGKSHLLGILTLLGDGLGHAEFSELHPHLTEPVNRLPRRFVVYFSLDEYDGSRLSLEEITWREIGLAARQCGFEIAGYDAATTASRSEQFLDLEEKLRQRGYSGLQLCVDELSLFLGAKDHRSLQSEASWLQFLGQRAARESTFTVWCCFALQKEWQDVGDLEPYSLSQVRDRYQTLTLSMAHLPALVQHRLVQQKDINAIHALCHKSYQELIHSWPQMEFGIAEWEALYPFHPATIELLEQLSSRFFSRTRSAVLFCATALKRYMRENRENAARIIAPQVFDYFKPEFQYYPELKELDRVWKTWEETIPRIAKEGENEIYITLLKTLLLFRLGGSDVTAIQLANTLCRDFGLGAEENYRYVHQLLVRWCKAGDHLSLDRGDNWQGDRFAVTLGQSIQQTVRRHTRRAMETLHSDDARIVSHLLESCGNADFPLKNLLNGASQVKVDWQNSPRNVEVALWQQPVPAQLLNQLLTWRQQNNVDVYLFLKVPFQKVQFPDLTEAPERNRSALLLWQPRRPTADEWEFARETVARTILHHDPALRDNRRGRAVIKFLERDLQERNRDIQHLMLRLYCEGRLICGDKRLVEISELCHVRNWNALIPTISAFALEMLYAKFNQVSPAVKVLSPSHLHQLGNKLLQRNESDAWWPASLDRPVRAIAVPLGLASEDKGRWKYAVGKAELIEEIELLLSEEPLQIAAIEAYLSASPWGLLPSQTALILCGMLGAGRLEALDARGKVLSLSQLKMPFPPLMYGMRRAALLEEKTWDNVRGILRVLGAQESFPLTFESQLRAAKMLREWRRNMVAEIELAAVRLRQLQKALDDSPALWQETTQIMAAVKVLLQAFDFPETGTLLESAAALEIDSFKLILQSWQQLQQALEANQSCLLQLLGRLNHLQLSLPADLEERRETLIYQFLEGEKVLFNTPLIDETKAWDSDFQQRYREWHRQQYSGERWQELRQCARRPELLAFQKMTAVARYPFAEHASLNTNLQTALHLQCPRDGSLLPGEVVCNHCRLRYGQLVELPDLVLFFARIASAARELEECLHRENIKRHLQRSGAGRSLLDWNGDAENLLPLLDEVTLSAFEKALQPRRRYQRSLRLLQQQLNAGGTRAEVESTFKDWLEAGDAIGAEDEIVISDE